MKIIITVVILIVVGLCAVASVVLNMPRCPKCGSELHKIGDKYVCDHCKEMF